MNQEEDIIKKDFAYIKKDRKIYENKNWNDLNHSWMWPTFLRGRCYK